MGGPSQVNECVILMQRIISNVARKKVGGGPWPPWPPRFRRLCESGALRTGSRQKTGIEHQHSRTHIMKAINETNFIVLVDVLT